MGGESGGSSQGTSIDLHSEQVQIEILSQPWRSA